MLGKKFRVSRPALITDAPFSSRAAEEVAFVISGPQLSGNTNHAFGGGREARGLPGRHDGGPGWGPRMGAFVRKTSESFHGESGLRPPRLSRINIKITPQRTHGFLLFETSQPTFKDEKIIPPPPPIRDSGNFVI